MSHPNNFSKTQVVVKNLNKIIDRNLYPVPEARNSNFRHRPIGASLHPLLSPPQTPPIPTPT